jgi:hypothetical protein
VSACFLKSKFALKTAAFSSAIIQTLHHKKEVLFEGPLPLLPKAIFSAQCGTCGLR